jgi:tetratricopeptide (TPR) repeat protein
MRGLAAVVAGLLLSGPVFADEEPSSHVRRVDAWLQAVYEHRPGEEDEPAYAIARWPNIDLKTLYIDLQAVLRFVRCPNCGTTTALVLGTTRKASVTYSKVDLGYLRGLAKQVEVRPGSANDLLKRAAILHADIAMGLAPEAVPITRGSSESSDRIVLRGMDGRTERIIDRSLHWEMGRGTLDFVGTPKATPAPKDDATVKLWYYATMAYLQADAMHDRQHFDRALKLFPADAEVQFQNGCLHESLASPPVQEMLRGTKLPAGVVVDVKSERDELEGAERHFRRALDLDPALAEARIRLGRVLGLLGRHADAAAELRRVTGDFDDERLAYYLALFLGREEEALGRLDAARDAFTRAAALAPRAQSPLLALSHLARAAGDRTAAQESARRVLDLPANEADRFDPLWVYHYVEGRRVKELLGELYQPFLAGPQP